MRHPARISLYCFSRARVRVSDRDLLQRNAVLHWTDVHAEIAADTLFVDDFKMTPAILFVTDRLMRGVFASDIAATALNAQFLVDVRLDGVVEVQMFPVDEVGHGFADKIGQPPVSLLVH